MKAYNLSARILYTVLFNHFTNKEKKHDLGGLMRELDEEITDLIPSKTRN